jgi:hypothetical protein
LYFIEIDQSHSMATIEPLDPNADEDDTGFLKIANVVSLAQKESETDVVSIDFILY